jgi:xylan 1,4-beta-xylosidase
MPKSTLSFRRFAAIAGSMAAILPLAAQIAIEDTSPCTQNFSSVKAVTKAGLQEWEDGVTYPGWHALVNGAPAMQYRATNANGAVPTDKFPVPVMLLRASGYDAALGVLSTPKYRGVIGARFINRADRPILSLDIRYRVRQWSHNTGGPTRLPFQYSLDALSLSSGTWHDMPALDAVSIKDSASKHTGINGNDPGNTKPVSGAITGIEIKPGQIFWIRWNAGEGSQRQQTLGIDDFSLSARFTPEGNASADSNIASERVTIDWSKREKTVTTRRHFSVNGQRAFNPEVTGNPAYIRGVRYLNPGLFRYHSTGMYKPGKDASGTSGGSWVDYENKTWHRERIKNALEGLAFIPGDEVMINISGWPLWMDADKDGFLDDDRIDAFAAFCADLVRFVNLELKRGVRYWEITNEKDFIYWRRQLASGNENELLGAARQKAPAKPRTAELAAIYNRAALAMKAVDPTIKTGGPAAASGEKNVHPMHREFIKLTLPDLDFFSFHGYPRTRTRTPAEIYDTPPTFSKNIRWHADLLKKLGPGRHIEIHLNEFNVASNWRLQDKRMHSEEGAVFDALFMIECARAGADALNAWSECDAVYGKMDKEFNLRIPAHVYHYFNAWMAGQSFAASPFGVTDGESGKKVVAFAVQTKEGHRNFVLVNRAREPLRAKLKFSGWNPMPQMKLQTARVDADGLTTGILIADTLAQPLLLPTDSVNFFSSSP